LVKTPDESPNYSTLKGDISLESNTCVAGAAEKIDERVEARRLFNIKP
jgi:hypothetical protein